MKKFILKEKNENIIFYDTFKPLENDLQVLFENYYPKEINLLYRDIKYIADKNAILVIYFQIIVC